MFQNNKEIIFYVPNLEQKNLKSKKAIQEFQNQFDIKYFIIENKKIIKEINNKIYVGTGSHGLYISNSKIGTSFTKVSGDLSTKNIVVFNKLKIIFILEHLNMVFIF